MKILVIDTETTKAPLCDPYNPNARMCYVGLLNDTHNYVDYPIEYQDKPYGEALKAIQQAVDGCDMLVGANIKFDLGWLRRYGIDFSKKRIWDVLLVQFILNNQHTPYVSLNDCAETYGLATKLDVVKQQYWEKGIDTPDIPPNILRPYLKQDVLLTQQVFELQHTRVGQQGIGALVTLHNQDILMLQEMEWSGLQYNTQQSIKDAMLVQAEIDGLLVELNALSPIIPRCWSTDFISQLLYGGVYKWMEKEAYIFTYKDGSTKEKMHNVEKSVELPRLVQPPRKARAKEGFWATDEATLQKLKTSGVSKKIVDRLLQVREKEKFVGTYLAGFPKKMEESCWEGERIHTNYNQVRAVTGRLSSGAPNVQNVPSTQKYLFESRYD